MNTNVATLTKSNKIVVTLFDAEKIGLNCTYHYYTSFMSDDDKCLKLTVDMEEFIEFLNEDALQYPGDEEDSGFDNLWDFFIDCWNDVARDYWDEILMVKLESQFNKP